MSAAWQIRRAGEADRAFMFEQAARLAAVADLPWHTEGDVLAFQHRFMRTAFARLDSEAAAFLAESPTGARLGFVHADTAEDPVTREPCAYVTLLAVTQEAEGKGVAAGLMSAIEDWARTKGFRLICLDVFANNRRGRAFYAKQGYQEDSLRLTKPL